VTINPGDAGSTSSSSGGCRLGGNRVGSSCTYGGNRGGTGYPDLDIPSEKNWVPVYQEELEP
jgi:hypothetical protein